MTLPVIWSPRALEDLIDIYTIIGTGSLLAADSMISQFEDRASSLSILPRMGVRRPEIFPSARMLVVGNYLVLYRTRPDTDEDCLEEVEIVRIVHSRRNIEAL